MTTLRISAAALVVLVVVGLLLRLDDLAVRPMGHIELFTPGVDYGPWELSIPHPRLTLWQTFKGSLAEPHPPAWYLVMFPWTKLLGADLFTIRLPSVLFGVASIVLVYLLARMGAPGFGALVAPALITVNGHHILWSQVARPYMMASFLGLLSTYLLARLVAGRGHAGFLLGAYLGVILLGLETNYYVWILFAAHILWVVLRSSTNEALMLGLARSQLALLIAVSPQICLVIYQATRPSYVAAVEPHRVLEFFSFGFLNETGVLAQVPFPLPPLVTTAVLPIAALGLLALGIVRARPTIIRGTSDGAAVSPPTRRQLILVTLFAWLCCFAAWCAGVGGFLPTGAAALAPRVAPIMVVPWVLLLAALALERYRQHVLRASRYVQSTAVLEPILRSVTTSLAIIPIAVITGVSLVVSLYAGRHLLIFTPYVVIVSAEGIRAIARLRPRWMAVTAVATLGVLLAVTHWGSVVYHKHRLTSSTDYQGLATRWLPELDPSDLIFVREHWVTTPLFYYVRGERYHYVGHDYAEAVRQRPTARIWLVTFDELAPSDAAGAALTNYRPARTLGAQGVNVTSYLPTG